LETIPLLGGAIVAVNHIIKTDEQLPDGIRQGLLVACNLLLESLNMLMELEKLRPNFSIEKDGERICTAMSAEIRVRCKDYNYAETEDCRYFTINGMCSKERMEQNGDV